MDLTNKVYDQLKTVLDPELGVNVVDLGLIYNVDFPSPRKVVITMTLTTPGCPLHDSISSGVKHSLEKIEGLDEVDVNIVWEPAWTPDRMTEEGRRMLS
jgi:metal-sulfur cluster biosynthetic enzyme